MSYRDWIELESDPGLFTLLVQDFGVQDVEVEEVYDLSKPLQKSVYGFIFLFKWTEERKSRRKAVVAEENFVFDDPFVNDMFFAQQVIPNSCASHALLSVLLNIPNFNLGYTLKQLREKTKGFDSETKGIAISNFRIIGVAHNNHGSPDFRWKLEKLKNVTTAGRSMEAFHYVSYIPYKGRLFELDGLKPFPINHGPWSANAKWSDKARQVIQERIRTATGGELSHDIRYNLLAVVPEQRKIFEEKLQTLSHNKKTLIELFKQLASRESFVHNLPSPSSLLKEHSENASAFTKTLRSSRASSPHSSSSSTVQCTETATNLFSDSEDSSVDTYRVKAILRGTAKPVVFVYGDAAIDKTETKHKQENTDNHQTLLDRKTDADQNHETTHAQDHGIEIIADDADIALLLDQSKLEMLSLEHLLKYEDKIQLSDVQKCMQDLDELYKVFQTSYKEEIAKIKKYKIEDCRRRHNYDPFISTFLTMLADQGQLADLLEKQSNGKVVMNNNKNVLGAKKDQLKKKKKKLKSK